jgi:hypothetical protein
MADSPLKQLGQLSNILKDDAHSLLEQTFRHKQDKDKRSYVRAVFAYIEGTTWAMKQVLGAFKNAPFTAQERALFNDVDYDLTEKGKVVEKRAKIPLSAKILFMLGVVNKLPNVSSEVDCGGQGWESLQLAIKIRDRLTHPKRMTDLDVSDDEVKVVTAAWNWFMDSLNSILEALEKTVVVKG